MTRLVLLMFAGLFLGLPASADEPPKMLTPEERKELEAKWKRLNTAGVVAFTGGKYAEATKALQDAIEVARGLYPKADFPDGHANLSTSIRNLATVLNARNQPREAEDLAREALGIDKKLAAGDDPSVAQSLIVLAEALKLQRKEADAEQTCREALALYKRLHAKDHPSTATALNNLALILDQRGKLAEADALLDETLGMKKRLYSGDHPTVLEGLGNLAALRRDQGRLADAESLAREASVIAGRLYKGDHPNVANALNNLGAILKERGQLAAAEPLLREAVAMRQRIFKGDHPAVAVSLNNLAGLIQEQGKLAEAERLFGDALGMARRLFKGDHPNVVVALNNLGYVLHDQGRYPEAEGHYREAGDMLKRISDRDHPYLAGILNNLAQVREKQGDLAAAEKLMRDSLQMRERLYKGDHPALSVAMNNLAAVFKARGKFAEAEPLFRAAADMDRRIFRGDHPGVVTYLSNLALVLDEQGKSAEAEGPYREAMAMTRRLVVAYAREKPEGEALTKLAFLPAYRDAFLSCPRSGKDPAAATYTEIWADKGLVARVYELRLQQARAAATDPRAEKLLAELGDARRRRAELVIAPQARDPATREKRGKDIQAFDTRITELDQAVRPLLPAIDRAEKLAGASPADLRRVLAPNVALIDFLRYRRTEFDPARPGREGEKSIHSYLAYVVTRDRITRVDLGPAPPIEAAIFDWGKAIISRRDIPAALPTRVRELVWEKVRKELLPGIKTVYISPDMALCRVPWAALPGDKPGTILLEDFAVATIPHAPFLLDQLWPQDERKKPPAGVLVVGGVDFQAEPAGAQPVNRDLPVKPGTPAAWPALPGAAAEASGVAGAATRKKLAVTAIKGEKATAAAVLGELPLARYAHFATHGFFADPSFRSVFQLDEKDYEKARWGERIGRAANSPLVMTGLVFAGANHPKTPGRGIVTGESLIDLDLSGLELTVLSACETGLGDVAGGEGTFGLQRAFHLAGAKNVVASLWKVRDDATAALMAEFYRNLWEKDLTPVEALRQAQLTIYRNPAKIGELAAGFRGKFEVVPGAKDEAIEPTADGKAHPHLWAAFTLSGPGH